MTKFDFIIIGGGLAGIYSALYLVSKGYKLALIDNNADLGGLLKSDKFVDQGECYEFDNGVHYLLQTSDPKINDVLTGFLQQKDWNWFYDSLPEANIFCGHLDKDTGCMDVRKLVDWKNIEKEALSKKERETEFLSLEDKILHYFGENTLEKIYTPFCKKIFALSPKTLAPEAFDTLAPFRLKISDDEEFVTKLKSVQEFDKCIAFPKRSLGRSSIIKGYPKNGKGIGFWVEEATRFLVRNGVTIFTSTELVEVKIKANKINALEVRVSGNRKVLSAEHYISGIPPVPIANMLGIRFSSRPIKRLDLGLLHLVFNKSNRLNDFHWVTNYDLASPEFRCSLYNNFSQSETDFRVSVEFIFDAKKPRAPQEKLEETLRTLKHYGLIGYDVELTSKFTKFIPGALPILQPGWKGEINKIAELIYEQAQNITLLGVGKKTGYGQINLVEDSNLKLQKIS